MGPGGSGSGAAAVPAPDRNEPAARIVAVARAGSMRVPVPTEDRRLVGPLVEGWREVERDLMQTKAWAIWLGLTCSFLLVPALGFAQREQTTVPGYDKLPDWSGVWSMMGGTVFDRATQTGEGGAISVGVRSHPPYTAEWEAIYKAHLDLRDKDQFPDTISNCGVPAGLRVCSGDRRRTSYDAARHETPRRTP